CARGVTAQWALGGAADLVAGAAAAAGFTGKNGSALDIVAPAGLKVSRLTVIGIGKAGDKPDLVKLGGVATGRIPAAATDATVLLEFPNGPLKAEQAADV